MPDFADKKEEMEFYLSLQNPKTGAFMDESYPILYYLEPTLNMVEHLELLAKETGRPLRLKIKKSGYLNLSSPGFALNSGSFFYFAG